MGPHEPIRCVLDTEHNGTEISLAENAIRTDMHPADQCEAFAKLHDEDGLSAEDITASSALRRQSCGSGSNSVR